MRLTAPVNDNKGMTYKPAGLGRLQQIHHGVRLATNIRHTPYTIAMMVLERRLRYDDQTGLPQRQLPASVRIHQTGGTGRLQRGQMTGHFDPFFAPVCF